MCKKSIRSNINEKRNQILYIDKKNKDKLIFEKVINSIFFKEANVIFVYVSFKSEVDTYNIIDYALKSNKIVCVPKVINKNEGMKALKINNLEEMIKSNYGILEPLDGAEEINAEKIDLALIPGLAFDLLGDRIGYGGGFYDVFLAKDGFLGKKIALCYDFQIIDKLPSEENDIAMDGLIWDVGVKYFEK